MSSGYDCPSHESIGQIVPYFGGQAEIISVRWIPGGMLASLRFVGDLPARWCEAWAIPPRETEDVLGSVWPRSRQN